MTVCTGGSSNRRHWELVDTAQFAHESGAGAALWKLDRHGRATSQEVVSAGGNSGTGDTVAAVETIDYQEDNPAWQRRDDLAQPATQNLAVALPDGNVLILGGRSGQGSSLVNSFWLQLFHPDSGSIERLGEGTVPRHDHSTALLLPDASVIVMGGNRTNLVPGDLSAGVPVAQIYRPPYLFRGHRPQIEEAPDAIRYGKRFHLKVSGDAAEIKSIALSRIGPVTHNWDWGNRLVELPVDDKHAGNERKLSARAPAVPGLAVPGYYMLFAVDEHGVPSVAKFVRLH